MQGDAPYRSEPSDIDQWFVRNNQGRNGSIQLVRANVVEDDADQPGRASWAILPYELQGQGAPGVSSGEAMDIMTDLASQVPGVSVAWAGQSYQERLDRTEPSTGKTYPFFFFFFSTLTPGTCEARWVMMSIASPNSRPAPLCPCSS